MTEDEERLRYYKSLGVDPESPNPDGSDYHIMNAVDEIMAANSLRRAQVNEMVHDVTATARDLAMRGLTHLDADDRTEALSIISRIEDRAKGGEPNLGTRRQKGMN